MKAPAELKSFNMQPVIRYPKDAEPDRNYLLSVDIRPEFDLKKWPYELEEYILIVKPNVHPYFTIKPLGESAIIIHRFGGTYGPAQFIITPIKENINAEISITLVNGWGIPVDLIQLEGIRIAYDTYKRFKIGTLITPKPRTVFTKPLASKEKPTFQKLKPQSRFKRFIEKILPPKKSEIYNILDEINGLEHIFQAMSDNELKRQTPKYKERYENGESLDEILPEAYALVRETAKRFLNMRHYDTQIIAGIALHQEKIIEMKNGEGKTFSTTLPGYLNALTGKGVHIMEPNDYFAMRNSAWFKELYQVLGISIGTIIKGMSEADRVKYESSQ